VAPRTWTCTQCGTSAETDDPSLLDAMGWKLDEDGRGLCTPCVKNHPGAARRGPARALPRPAPSRRSTGDA